VPYAAVAATVLLWGSAFPAIAVALGAFTPAQLSVLRLAVASAALGIAAPVLHLGRPDARDLSRIALAGLTGMTLYQLLLNGGQRSVPAGTASLLVATAPIGTALLARAVLGERLRPRQWAGTAVAFCGAALLALRDGGLQVDGAALAVLAAAACQATFFVVQKPLLDRYRAVEVTAWAMWAGTALALPFGGGALAAVAAASPVELAALAWLGVGASAAGFVAWAVALARLPAGVGANALFLVPCVALAVAWPLLGEVPGPPALAGGALCLVGVGLVRSGQGRSGQGRHDRGALVVEDDGGAQGRDLGPLGDAVQDEVLEVAGVADADVDQDVLVAGDDEDLQGLRQAGHEVAEAVDRGP